MRSRPLALAIGLALGLSLTAVPHFALAQPATAAAAQPPAVAPEALLALQRMGAYLGTLPSFEVTAITSLDLVTESDQTVQIDGVTRYKVRRPNGFNIEVTSDRQSRQFIYDGKQLTVYAPHLGYYATVPAPPTIRETLDRASDRYGIELPLKDLFTWSDPNNGRPEDLISGFVVGPATIDGVDTVQYAFREGDTDWQIWIQTGDQPIPRKLVIIDRSDSARPAYTARLTWNVNPTLVAEDFAFHAGKDAMPIQLTSIGQ